MTMKLHDLRPAEGATRNKKRVGRGHGSGHGKTSTRGNNGQGQRSGESIKRGFEGGQMPLYRQTPKKKHFQQPNRAEWSELTFRHLLDKEGKPRFDAGTEITPELLKDAGILKKQYDGIRVLGGGEISGAYTIHAHHFTASAREKIEAAGGKAVLIGGEEASGEAEAS